MKKDQSKKKNEERERERERERESGNLLWTTSQNHEKGTGVYIASSTMFTIELTTDAAREIA